jgi:preprotein translocase subunit SecG
LLYVLYTIFILACVVLILSVLLQPGKSDAGALFTSSLSSTAFGPRGTQTLLAKITIFAAAAFMFFAILISMGVGGYRSVVSPGDASQPQQTPAPVTVPEEGDTETLPVELTPTEPEAVQPPSSNTSATPASTESPR